MQDIEFNSVRGSMLQIFAKDLITVPAAEPNMEEINLAGRDGTTYKFDGTYKATVIPIAFKLYRSGKIDGMIAGDWLNNGCQPEIQRSEFLMIANFFIKSAMFHLEIMNELQSESETSLLILTLSDGLQYLLSGQMEYTSHDVEWNPYLECHPVYKITAEGMCTLSVNGKTMMANVSQNLIIDTDRMIAFRSDGTLNNTKVSGNYEDLYLKPGQNKIECVGGELSVIPNWRCL